MNATERRARELEEELRDLISAIAHDLRAPLRAVDGFSRALLETAPADLDAGSQHYLSRIREASRQLTRRIEALVRLGRASTSALACRQIDLAALARTIVEALRQSEPDRQVTVEIADGLTAFADPALGMALLECLLDNAWKFTRRRPNARIELGRLEQDGEQVFFVRDSGIGFDMAQADSLFQPFARLHAATDDEGLGIGLALARRIVARHNGRIWAEAERDRGATLYFTLAAREAT
jgi:light-regulated signal transduction histidine kinase (bacteriophytochrome)